eukprot:g72485.t1
MYFVTYQNDCEQKYCHSPSPAPLLQSEGRLTTESPDSDKDAILHVTEWDKCDFLSGRSGSTLVLVWSVWLHPSSHLSGRSGSTLVLTLCHRVEPDRPDKKATVARTSVLLAMVVGPQKNTWAKFAGQSRQLDTSDVHSFEYIQHGAYEFHGSGFSWRPFSFQI